MNIHEIGLDNRAGQFIQRRLNDGKTFSRAVLESIDISTSQVFTWLPSNSDMSQMYDFNHGGKLPLQPKETWVKIEGGWSVPRLGTHYHLIKEIQDYFAKTKYPLGIFENAYAQPKDKGLIKNKQRSRLWFFENEVYHAIVPHDQSFERVLESIREAEHVPIFIGGLASLPNDQIYSLNSRECISLDYLRLIARCIEELIIGAYDGESYLIWRKNGVQK